MLERLFKLQASGTTVRREVVAGATTFMTMAYIIFVQPQVLKGVIAGDGISEAAAIGAVLVATCLSAAVATFLMGFLANYPIALAPGMGENFFFTYTVCAPVAMHGMGFSWQEGLLIVLVSGVLFLALTLLKVRKAIISAIPSSIKNAIAVGIGIFIAFIGLKEAGIVVEAPGSYVTLGRVFSPPVVLAAVGFIVTVTLIARRVPGGILLGIIGTAVLGLIASHVARAIDPAFSPLVEYQGVFSAPPSIRPTFFAFVHADFANVLTGAFVTAVVVFLFMDVFDTMGTLVGVGERAGFIVNNELPRADRALMADATGTVVGAMLGTSTVTSYIESAAGVEAGGRTGLANMVTGALFLLALFVSPLVAMIAAGYGPPGREIYPVTAPALIIVGSMMMQVVTRIEWRDATEAVPAFLIMIGIPLTYSIANGFAFGFIAYPTIKLLAGRGREVKPLLYVLAVLFVLYYIFFQP
jgi:AGZA family xanthine/uracil permease-like MFS transporter